MAFNVKDYLRGAYHRMWFYLESVYKTVMKAIVMKFSMVTVAVKKKYLNYISTAKNHYLFFPFLDEVA